MIKDTISDDMINIMLRQKGACSIKSIPAHVNLVKFEITPGITILYMYELNEEGKVFIERITPYPLKLGKLNTESKVVETIMHDFNAFQSAYNSRNYEKFIMITARVQSFDIEMEELFFRNNVRAKDLDRINEALEDLHLIIKSIADESDPL